MRANFVHLIRCLSRYTCHQSEVTMRLMIHDRIFTEAVGEVHVECMLCISLCISKVGGECHKFVCVLWPYRIETYAMRSSLLSLLLLNVLNRASGTFPLVPLSLDTTNLLTIRTDNRPFYRPYRVVKRRYSVVRVSSITAYCRPSPHTVGYLFSNTQGKEP